MAEAGPFHRVGCNDRPVDRVRNLPPFRIRLAGHLVTRLVATFPASWVLLRPGVEAFFDSAASSWDSRSSAGSYEHLEPLAVALGRVEVRPERVLDIGCGTGETTLFLAREFPAAGIRGVDLSEEMVRRATRKTGLDPSARVSFRVGDGSALPWPDRSFDLVVQVNVPLFPEEVARVLRKKGEFVSVSTLGRDTPFDTPERAYRRAVIRAGMVPAASGTAGCGTWRIARLSGNGTSH